MPTQHEIATDQMTKTRRAWRDRYHVEPKIDDVHSIVRGMNDNGYTAAESITAQENLRAILDADQPDPYQEARLALRDLLGMEPDEQMIRNTMDTARQPRTTVKQAATLTIGAAKLADAAEEPKAHTALYTEEWVNADFGVVVFVNDNDVAGLARLRAHSALDALLDQHGISR